MKIKLLSLITLLFAFKSNLISQCSVTLSPIAAYGGPGTYTIGVNGFIGPFQLCPNVILYDTMGSNSRTYYCHSGSTLYLKNGFGHKVHLKGGSILNISGGGPGSINVYREINAGVNGTVTPITTTCAAVAFPTIACPAPTVTGLNEFSELEVVIIYPNPSSDQINIFNTLGSSLQIEIFNVLGEKVKTFVIESGNTKMNVSDLNEGIYFLIYNRGSEFRKSKRIIINR